MPAQSPVRVTKKELDSYDIEVVPRGVCPTASPPRGSDVKRNANAKRLFKESFRFLLEREPNTSILRSFHITDISRYFPNTNVKFGAVWPDGHRLGRRFPA
jgi:hypothetical protein